MKHKPRLFHLLGIVLCSVLMCLPVHAANASIYKPQASFASISYEKLVVPANETVIVKSGDTLSKLASKYSFTWQGLYCANRKVVGPDPNVIRVGMKLVLKQAKCHIGSGSTTNTITTTGYTSPSTTPQQIAWGLLASFGGDRPRQYACLNHIIMHESSWNVYASNSSSGAYGIPQALPGSKMGPGWQNSAYVQLHWMIKEYIPGTPRYGTPCGAWYWWTIQGWY